MRQVPIAELVSVTSLEPLAEFVTHDEVVAHCRIDQVNDEHLEDHLITMYRRAAISRAQIICNRVFVPSRVVARLPVNAAIMRVPLVYPDSIESVGLEVGDDTIEWIDRDHYTLDGLHLCRNRCIDSGATARYVRVVYGAHFRAQTELDIDDVRLGILMLAGHFYNNREASAPIVVHEIPNGAMDLLYPHRFHSYF